MTRAELLTLCRRASVPQDKWNDRDSASAQLQLGEAYALLAAGCEYSIDTHRSSTSTIWITIWYRGFTWFEGTGDPIADQDLAARDRLCDVRTYYLPTASRLCLALANGSDWY